MVEPLPHRRCLGYVLAAPVLVTAAELTTTCTAVTPLPSSDVTGLLGLNDIMTAAALPASGLISVEVSRDGAVSFVLPRARIGRAVTASSAVMLIAEELSIPCKRVHVTLADSRPELVFDQMTNGSHTAVSAHTSLRIAAVVARQRLLEAASAVFDSPLAYLQVHAGVITDGTGRSLDIGALATKAASTSTVAVAVELPTRRSLAVVGQPTTGSPYGER